MKGRSLLTLAVIGAVIIAIAVGGVLYQSRPTGTGNHTTGNTTTAGDNTTTVRRTNLDLIATAPAFPFVQRWAAQYNSDQATVNLKVSYLQGGEAAGDLAIVGTAGSAGNRYYIPVSAQALSVVYNVPGVPDLPSGLKLDISILSRILNGSIVRWNDPAIANLNHDMNLPNERITVVHDTSNSSSSVLLRQHLPSDVVWPADSIAASSPDELASLIRKTPYSIGYVDFSYAIQTKMTLAAIAELPNDQYVLPSVESIGQAVNSSLNIQNITSANESASVSPPLLNASMLGNGSYPLTGLYYVSLPTNVTKNATIDFVKWMIDGGQETLSEVQYPSIYQDNRLLVTYSETIIEVVSSRLPTNSTSI